MGFSRSAFGSLQRLTDVLQCGASWRVMEMTEAFLRIPVRFWLRVGVVASLLWLVVATLWHWLAISHETVMLYLHHLQLCQADKSHPGNDCAIRAGLQFNNNRSSVWSMALFQSAVQIAFLWLLGCILIAGTRWAGRALRPVGTSA